MDKYENFIIKNKLTLKKTNQDSQTKTYLTLDISFDKFSEFLEKLTNIDKLQVYKINIYDEDIITDPEQITIRYKLLKFLNQTNFIKINFYLSDSSLNWYNQIMSKINWNHQKTTKLILKTDRNPVPKNRNLHLEKAQGKLLLPEEKLIWCCDTTLEDLKGKVDEKVLKDTIELKKIIFDIYYNLNEIYNTKDFTEFDKVWIIYSFIKKYIKYAEETTIIVNGKEEFYNPNGINNWASTPYGTFQHQRGICLGQARLMQILLNNPYMKCDTTTIIGEHVLGKHAWSGTVIDGTLYQTCLTMSHVLKDLSSINYKPNEDQIYPKIYQSSSTSYNDLEEIKKHIKSLRRKK